MKKIAAKVKRRLKRLKGSVVRRLSQKTVFAGIYSEVVSNPCVQIVVETKDFFQKEIDQNGEFNRYDTIVRFLAVENYYGENDYGFELYRKMQKKRNPEDYESKDRQETFERLIRSFEKSGLSDRYPLEVSNKLKLLDGSHRFALILYHGIPSFSITPVNSVRNTRVNYGIQWFSDNGFSAKEIGTLKGTFSQLKAHYMEKFSGVLWSPALPFKDEILKDISNSFNVTEVREIEFDNRLNYENFVFAMYHIDDIAKWKVIKKLEYMSKYPTKACIFLFETCNPQYRKKARNNQAISVAIETIKKQVRRKYASRLENYFHDILLHMGDNEQHTDFMEKLYEPGLNIGNFIDRIRGQDYVLVKTDVPYMPRNFPNTFPLGKDLDIVCTQESFEPIRQQILDFAESENPGFNLIEKVKENEFRLRFELEGFLIYQLDLRTKIHDMNTAQIIGRREAKNNYFVPTLADEAMLRAKEFAANNRKMHHQEFVESAMHQLDVETRTAVQTALNSR